MASVFIVLIVFTFILAMQKLHLDHKKRELSSHAASGSGSSLGTSELQSLIRSAVSDAIEPLVERMEKTESRLDETEQLLLDEASEKSPATSE